MVLNVGFVLIFSPFDQEKRRAYDRLPEKHPSCLDNDWAPHYGSNGAEGMTRHDSPLGLLAIVDQSTAVEGIRRTPYDWDGGEPRDAMFSRAASQLLGGIASESSSPILNSTLLGNTSRG